MIIKILSFIICSWWQCTIEIELSCERHIQNPFKHLRWSIFESSSGLLAVHCFCKKPHLRCLAGLWIRHWFCWIKNVFYSISFVTTSFHKKHSWRENYSACITEHEHARTCTEILLVNLLKFFDCILKKTLPKKYFFFKKWRQIWPKTVSCNKMLHWNKIYCKCFAMSCSSCIATRY